MQRKQKQNFNKIGTREKPLENFNFDLDVPKSISLREYEEQRIWKSLTVKIFLPMNRTMILALQSVGFGMGES